MFVLRTRNSAGAPETSALTLMPIGKIDSGESVNPGTVANFVDDVVASVVRHAVSRQFTGVIPPPVPAKAAQPTPPTSVRVATTTNSFRIVALLRAGFASPLP